MKLISQAFICLYGFSVLAALFGQFNSFPIPEFREKISALVCVGFIFFGLISLGDVLLKLGLRKRCHEIEDVHPNFNIAIRLGLGISFISTLTLILGKIPIGSLSGKLTVMAFLMGATCLLSVFNGRYRNFLPKLDFLPSSKFQSILIGVSLLGLMASFICCFSPITYYDSLVYHLGLPSQYIQSGSISNPSTNLYYYFPQNLEMIFLLILDRIPNPEYVINLFCWGISLLTSFLIFNWAKESGGDEAGYIGFVLWWTMPAVLLLSIGGYIDIPLSFFVLISFRLFFRNFKQESRLLPLFLSGFFSGVSFSTKYTGAIVFMILFTYLIVSKIWVRRTKLLPILFFFLGFLVPATPWLLKNFFEIGNPVFPFFYKFLGFEKVGWTNQTAEAYFQILTEYGASSHVFWELILSPWKIVNSSTTFGGGFDVLGDFGWLLILFSIPVLFITKNKEELPCFLLMSCVLYFVLWFLTKPVLRFLISGLPLFVVLSSIAISSVFQFFKKIPQAIFLGIFSICLTSNFFIYALVQHEIDPYSVALGWDNREKYLGRKLSFFEAYTKLNQNSKVGGKTLIIGEQRIFHLEVPSISSNLFGPSYIANICNQSDNISDIARFFDEKNIKFISIHHHELRRLGGLEKFGFSSNGVANLNEFLNKNADLMYGSSAIEIFSL